MRSALWSLFSDHFGTTISKVVIGTWILGEGIMGALDVFMAQADLGHLEQVVNMNDSATWKYLTLAAVLAIAYLVKQMREESLLTRDALVKNTQAIEAFTAKVDGVVMPVFTNAVDAVFYQPGKGGSDTLGAAPLRKKKGES